MCLGIDEDASGFGSTYEGLKLGSDYGRRLSIPSFGSAYEGLKHEYWLVCVLHEASFGSTYEGLKPPSVR